MLLWFPKKDQPAECALRKKKRKTVKKFSCPTQISNRVGGGEKKKSPQVHPGHENIYIFIIYIKCLIYSNMYTLHKMSGEGVSHNEALLHQVTSKYSWGKKKIKKVQPKNKPKDKRTKKSSFLSSTSILRPTAPLISTSTLWEICSPQTVGQGENFNLSRSAEAEREPLSL